MNKALKTILIVSIAIFGAGFLSIDSVQAQPPDNLVVQFERTPSLFDEANFLPGESVTRYADVTNNSGETKKIGLEIINNSSCSGTCLSDVLDLVISENGNPLPLYSDSLTNFYGAGEKVLSDLNTGTTTKYYFSMTFNPGAGNIYQDTSVNFNIRIGFFGEESIGEEIPLGGVDGGGVFIAGLEISDERVSDVGTSSVTIVWDTNKEATSRVIYSAFDESRSFDPNLPPNYGYRHSNTENPAKIIFHSMTITGLKPATTYYFRCVSHTSPDEAISTQLSFTTKGVAGAAEEIVPLLPEAPPLGKEEGIEPEVEGESIEEDKEGIVEETTIGEDKDLDKFLATAGACMAAGNLCWLFFAVIIILTVLYLLSRDKKEKEIKKKDLIFLLIIILLIILYCIFCCSCCWILILVISLLFILFAFLNIYLTKSQSV